MAVDYFLKIDTIEGESQDQKHKGWIQLESWSFGETQTGTHGYGGGGGSGKVNMQDFQFVKRACKAGPKLFQACAQGEHFKKVELTCRKAGKDQQEYYKITLSDVLVSSYQTGGSGAAEIPMEQFSLNFAKVEFDYAEQKPDGTLGAHVKAGFDLSKAAAV